MSETNAAVDTKKELQVIPLPAEFLGKSITRNEVTKELVPHTLLKGKRAGNQYLGFSFNPETFESDVKFIGLPNVINILNGFGKKAAQDIWNGATPDEGEGAGQVNLDQFIVEIASFDTSGLTLKEIDAKIDEYVAVLMRESTKSSNFLPENLEAFRAQMQDLQEKINAYKAMAAKRSSRGRKDEEAEPATVG